MTGKEGGSTPPRRGPYYGWRIAGALAVTETVSWGVLYYAFAVFLVPMQEELGWSRTALTGAYSLGLLASGLAAPLVGRWLDRHGPRGLMTLGSALGTVLVLAWASVEDLWAFYLVWVGVGLAMSATLYEPAFAVLARWFERERGRALLLVTLAGGLASTILLPLSAWLFALQAAALVILIVWQAPLGVLAFALPFGAASGAMTISRASAVAEFYGPGHYGSIGGAVGTFVIGARTVAPVGAGAMFASLGGYAPVLWTLAAGSAAAVAMFLARRLAPALRPAEGTDAAR